MPLDALQKEILADAKKRADAIGEKAMKEADATVKEAKARADAASAEFERDLKDEIGRMSLEYRSSREMQERNIRLSAREQLTDGLVERVRGAVMRRIREKGMRRLFDSAIAEALKISPMKDLILVMDKKDAKYAKDFTGKVKYEKTDGLVVYAAGGKVKIDATLGTIFERNRDAVKEAIRSGVFGTGGASAAKRKSAKKAKAGKRAAPKPKQKRRRKHK
jgi:vacuolar-type H+-ATPase subunit E/Vma4